MCQRWRDRLQEWVSFSELFAVHSSHYTFRSGLTTVWQLHLSWQDISDSCVYVEYMVFVPLCPAFSPYKEGKHFSYKTVGLFGLGWGNLSRKSTGRRDYQGNYSLGNYWWIEELLCINKSLFLTRHSASPCQNLVYTPLFSFEPGMLHLLLFGLPLLLTLGYCILPW